MLVRRPDFRARALVATPIHVSRPEQHYREEDFRVGRAPLRVGPSSRRRLVDMLNLKIM